MGDRLLLFEIGGGKLFNCNEIEVSATLVVRRH